MSHACGETQPTEERHTIAATTFNIDEQMNQTLEDLKAHYGASSKAAVLRKAVALLKVAMANEQPDGSIAMQQPNNDILKVLIR